jgi:hypothetical protein
MSEARPVRGADEDTDTKNGDEPKKKGDALDAYCDRVWHFALAMITKLVSG